MYIHCGVVVMWNLNWFCISHLWMLMLRFYLKEEVWRQCAFQECNFNHVLCCYKQAQSCLFRSPLLLLQWFKWGFVYFNSGPHSLPGIAVTLNCWRKNDGKVRWQEFIFSFQFGSESEAVKWQAGFLSFFPWYCKFWWLAGSRSFCLPGVKTLLLVIF